MHYQLQTCSRLVGKISKHAASACIMQTCHLVQDKGLLVRHDPVLVGICRRRRRRRCRCLVLSIPVIVIKTVPHTARWIRLAAAQHLHTRLHMPEYVGLPGAQCLKDMQSMASTASHFASSICFSTRAGEPVAWHGVHSLRCTSDGADALLCMGAISKRTQRTASRRDDGR
jgi:hypothetical protein